MILKSNERKGKTGILAKPKLKGDVKSGLWKSIPGSTDLPRGIRLTRSIYVREGRIRKIGKLGSVSDHGIIPLLLTG
jgi:hypothetical protein